MLLSHDQHPDNFDRLGREYAARAPLVLSTASAARRLGPPVRALGNWESTELAGSVGELVRVTGVPAQHGPDGSEELVGEVTGFVLSRPGLPALYISGDNASIQVIRRIAERLGLFDRAILFAGAARAALAGGAPLALTSEHAARRPTYSTALPPWRCISKAGPLQRRRRRTLECVRAARAVQLPAHPKPGELMRL